MESFEGEDSRSGSRAGRSPAAGRPPERSGDRGAPRATAKGGPQGEAPRIETVMRLETTTLSSLRLAAERARRATGAPAGAERGSWGPASDGEGGPRGRSPPDQLTRRSW